VTQRVIRAGDRLALDSGIILEVLHPSDEPVASADSGDNNNSVVLRLVWGEAGFLLTGDIEAEAEHLLVESGQPLPSDVLKVSHHGSGGSSTPEFLAAVAPSYAIISVGAGNDYGHPQDAVLDRLAQLDDVEILRTDEQGTIEFVTDGNRLWVQTER
jgi:competence protein ComEC